MDLSGTISVYTLLPEKFHENQVTKDSKYRASIIFIISYLVTVLLLLFKKAWPIVFHFFWIYRAWPIVFRFLDL